MWKGTLNNKIKNVHRWRNGYYGCYGNRESTSENNPDRNFKSEFELKKCKSKTLNIFLCVGDGWRNGN